MMMSLKDLIEAEQNKFSSRAQSDVSANDIDSLIKALEEIRRTHGNLSLTIPNVFKLLSESR